jgi:hypothetical protein
MNWRILITVFAFGSLQILMLRAEEPLKLKTANAPPPMQAAPVLVTDLAAMEEPTPALAPASVKAPDAAAARADDEGTKADAADALALQLTQAELKEKDAVIEKLAAHLESALARLNATSCPVTSGSTSIAALTAVRAELEQQNNILKEKQERLQGQIDELTKKSQLLDLENRQLFEALNGRPYSDRDAVKPAKSEVTRHGGQVASEE